MPDSVIPNHIGFVVDGNRRWAKQRGLPSYEGHKAGYDAIHNVVIECFNSGVKYVSAYIFSTENWKRSADEVSYLMGLILKMLTSDLSIFQKNNIKLIIVGSRENLSPSIIKAIDNAELKTANNDGGTLALCFNYGGQLEIVDALKNIVDSKIAASDITVDLITENLYAPHIPPIDLVVRTSGEQRLSNFMLWRVAYSELMFIDKMWPDMTKGDVADIIKEYNRRSRRFGG